MHKKLIIFNFIVLLSFAYQATAQKQLNSPYSRFNIGTLEPRGSYKSRAMGGIGTAMRDNNSIFYMNPASYSSLDTNSFSFDFGFDFGLNILKENDNRYTSNDMNFNHLVMGFPISRGLGVAFGIMPVSDGYYNISENVQEGDTDYNPLTGPYNTYHKGKGGLSNFFAGTGVNINKNFSLGLNMTLMFGTLERSYTLQFSDLENYYHNSAYEKMQVRGINFDYGIQYRGKIKEDYFIQAGFSLTSGKTYKSNYDYLAVRTSAYNVADTVNYISDNSTPVFLPGTYRAGIVFGKTNKFTTGVDFTSTDWNAAKIPGFNDYAASSKTVAWGFELIPDKFSNFSLLKRLEYRAGAHYGDNYLIINGSQVKEYGASFGIGLPMRRTNSRANLFIDYTRRSGSAAAGLHDERIITIGGSLNIYDMWFLQRKYN
ncbi:MAG TPA: hypothetical protein VMV47_07975 [Bacteroidales bacterium]|nr:hypothetical protein [Bacteroidales bacterium]